MKDDQSADERRTSNRLQVEPVNIHGDLWQVDNSLGKPVPTGGSISFYMIDCSETGFKLWLGAKLERDTLVYLRFKKMSFWGDLFSRSKLAINPAGDIPLGNADVDCLAQVVWVQTNQGSDGFSCGIQIEQKDLQVQFFSLYKAAIEAHKQTYT